MAMFWNPSLLSAKTIVKCSSCNFVDQTFLFIIECFVSSDKESFFLATVAIEEAGLDKNSRSEVLHLNCLQPV